MPLDTEGPPRSFVASGFDKSVGCPSLNDEIFSQSVDALVVEGVDLQLTRAEQVGEQGILFEMNRVSSLLRLIRVKPGLDGLMSRPGPAYVLA